MTNEQTIEKLNEALTQLIDAYEVLLEKNNKLEEEMDVKSGNINDLENKLLDLNGSTEVQSSKMDGMLTRIQSILGSSNDDTISETTTSSNDDIDLRIDSDLSFLDEKEEEKDEEIEVKANENKIDLGRMESLLNGLNTK